MKKLALPVLVCVAIVLFVLGSLEGGPILKCPVLLLTGFKCPGCGGQRALYCLLHGDVLQAIKYNCFLTLFAPLFLIGLYKGPFADKPWYPFIGLCAMVVYTVARNL